MKSNYTGRGGNCVSLGGLGKDCSGIVHFRQERPQITDNVLSDLIKIGIDKKMCGIRDMTTSDDNIGYKHLQNPNVDVFTMMDTTKSSVQMSHL